jgi:hypothetical protein
MSEIRRNKIRLVTLASAIFLVAMLGDPNLDRRPGRPSVEDLRSLIDGYAHAIETNTRDLALRYIHPDSPRRPDIAASLHDQLTSHMERARIPHLGGIEVSGGTISAELEQEFVRVFGLKFTRGSRRSVYHFRELGESWRIWGIDEVAEL